VVTASGKLVLREDVTELRVVEAALYCQTRDGGSGLEILAPQGPVQFRKQLASKG
jgi:hypothetical protein